MMRMRIAVAGLVAACTVACAGQPEAPAVSFSVGSLGANYLLTAVADKALPTTAYEGVGVSVRATGGTLTLSGDRAYTMKVQYVRHFAAGDREVSFEVAEQGTWSASKDAVTLTPSGTSPHTVVVNGDNVAITLTVPDASPVERATKVYRFTKL